MAENHSSATSSPELDDLIAEVTQADAAGKAYHAVAQATAMAVQDAVDHLRNVSTVAGTAIGVALAEFLETGEQNAFDTAVEAATSTVRAATNTFSEVGTAAAAVLNGFPSGDEGSGPTDSQA